MTDRLNKIDPPFVFTGNVTRSESSGARRFQFNLSDGRNEPSFLIRDAPDTSDPMFVTMSVTVALAYATKTHVEVTSYHQFEDSKIYLVNILR